MHCALQDEAGGDDDSDEEEDNVYAPSDVDSAGEEYDDESSDYSSDESNWSAEEESDGKGKGWGKIECWVEHSWNIEYCSGGLICGWIPCLSTRCMVLITSLPEWLDYKGFFIALQCWYYSKQGHGGLELDWLHWHYYACRSYRWASSLQWLF